MPSVFLGLRVDRDVNGAIVDHQRVAKWDQLTGFLRTHHSGDDGSGDDGSFGAAQLAWRVSVRAGGGQSLVHVFGEIHYASGTSRPACDSFVPNIDHCWKRPVVIDV